MGWDAVGGEDGGKRGKRRAQGWVGMSCRVVFARAALDHTCPFSISISISTSVSFPALHLPVDRPSITHPPKIRTPRRPPPTPLRTLISLPSHPSPYPPPTPPTE